MSSQNFDKNIKFITRPTTSQRCCWKLYLSTCFKSKCVLNHLIKKLCIKMIGINWPSVAGSVQQSPLWLIYSFIYWLSNPLLQISSKPCQSQTGRGMELIFWENVHLTLGAMCHVSPVTCHMSRVTGCIKKILFKKNNDNHITNFFYPKKKLDKVVKLVGGGSVINGAYPV